MVQDLTLTPKGVRNVLSVLSGALADAERQGLVTRNVAALVRRPRIARPAKVELGIDDIRTILAAVKGDRYEVLFITAVASGVRQAELLGLRWSDWRDGALHVANALARQNGRYGLVEPKTATSRRTVTLPAFANAALARHHAAQTEERLAAGPGTEEGLIFLTPAGRPVNQGWLTHHWRKLSRPAGLDLTFHGLRHCQTSLLVALGVHPRVIAERLGHASSRVSMDVYAHVSADTDRAVANLLEAALAP